LFRTLLLVLALTWAGVAIFFLLRFLRANDEREQQVNYRALTFAFTGTLFQWLSTSYRASAFLPFDGLAFLGS
jgi:hypothetical protein